MAGVLEAGVAQGAGSRGRQVADEEGVQVLPVADPTMLCGVLQEEMLPLVSSHCP